MNIGDTLNNLADYVLLSALPGIALFIIYYAAFSNWKKRYVGRSMMYLAMGLLGLFIINTLTLFAGQDYPLRPLIRILGYAILSFTVWRLFFTLRRLQKEPRPPEDHMTSTNEQQKHKDPLIVDREPSADLGPLEETDPKYKEKLHD